MIEIIPAILDKSFEQIVSKIKRVEQETSDIKWVQLDVMDGKFVPNTAWNKPKDLVNLKTDLKLEVHLMIEEPQKFVKQWIEQQQIKRILVHWEAIKSEQLLFQIINKVKNQGKEIGVVLNPETPIKIISKYLDEIMLMGVHPGFSGQKFIPETLEKIKKLRKLNADLPIGVDGGVNLDTAEKIINSGATRLCVASYFWAKEDLAEAVKSLMNL